jgi:hypothetical protein
VLLSSGRIAPQRPNTHTASMAMTIAINCASTRNCINLCERCGDPPRIMFTSPSSSINETAPTAMGSRIARRKVSIVIRYHPVRQTAIAPMWQVGAHGNRRSFFLRSHPCKEVEGLKFSAEVRTRRNSLGCSAPDSKPVS